MLGATVTFAGVISREAGLPWPDDHMTTQKWLRVPIRYVRIKDLIATQPGVYFADLIEPGESRSGDSLPHVVSWEGKLYLEDGHHRVTRAALDGFSEVMARVRRPVRNPA